MRPQAAQAGQQVFHLREFYLGFGLGGLRAVGKDVEDERGAVHDLHLERFFQMVGLLSAEVVVEDDHVDLFVPVQVLCDLLHLALADKTAVLGMLKPLGKALRRHRTGGGGEELEFVEIFVRLHLRDVRCDEAHQHGVFRFFF